MAYNLDNVSGLLNFNSYGINYGADASVASDNSASAQNGFNFTQNPNFKITQEGPSSLGPGNMLGGLGGIGKALSKANPYLAMGTAALGAIQTIGGLVGLARTKQPEGFKLTPKMQQAIGESESAARYGLGAQQIGLAQQNQREAQNAQFFNARSLSGGNLSRAIFGANTFNRLMAGNQLAAQDFAAQQQKVRYRDQMFGQEQAIANQNVQLAQQDYMRKQQAYGGAMSSGLTNLGSFFNLQNALRYNA